MLLQFRFSNYRSFSHDALLDMRASGSNEYEWHVRKEGCDRVLPVSAIYGANASGKSNVYQAFAFMHRYVRHSFYLEESAEEGIKKDAPVSLAGLQAEPFLFDRSDVKAPCKFETEFIVREKERDKYYQYGFSLDQEGIAGEWLKTNSKTGILRGREYQVLFDRERGKHILWAASLSRYKNNIEISLQDRTLILSLGAKLKVRVLTEIRRWFLQNETVDYSNPMYDYVLCKVLPHHIVEDSSVKKQVLQFLHSFDDSIIDLVFRKIPAEKEGEADQYRIFSVHETADSKKNVCIPFDEESSGTMKMFALYQPIADVLRVGGVFFADELEIKLHPLLMRNIIRLFTNPDTNPHRAQLIFTAHNTVYMDMHLLRRDEIWFTEKMHSQSELYSLDDIEDSSGNKVRKDINYEKNYLLGRFGGVPQLRDFYGEPDHGQA